MKAYLCHYQLNLYFERTDPRFANRFIRDYSFLLIVCVHEVRSLINCNDVEYCDWFHFIMNNTIQFSSFSLFFLRLRDVNLHIWMQIWIKDHFDKNICFSCMYNIKTFLCIWRLHFHLSCLVTIIHTMKYFYSSFRILSSCIIL